MTFRFRYFIAAGALMLACGTPVLAQSAPTERVAIDVGVAGQTSSTTFSQTVTFESSAETGTLSTSYSIAQHPRFDIGAAGRLWRGFGVGVAATAMSGTDPAQITGAIPHPINPNQPRALNGTVDAFHRESAVHLQAVYWMQPSRRIDLIVGAGPSFVRMEQDFVSDVSYSETFPYTSVTFEGASVQRQKQHAVGFNVGGRVGVRIVDHIGVSGLIRYSRSTLTFSDTAASSVRLGGTEMGGGLHLTF